MRIEHADGESIVIEKSDAQQTTFDVVDIPSDRELSYATVANATGGALSTLELDEVRRAVDGSADVTTSFETWDGLQIVVAITEDDETAWLAFIANSATPDAAAAAQAHAINARLSGWQYQVPGYKKDPMARRWDDLLKGE